MSTESVEMRVGDLAVHVVRKDIKNLHLGVYPPNGRIRVAVPLRLSDEAVRLAVIGKLSWIKKQQAKFAAQARESEREMVSGETHYYLGRRYRLWVVEHQGASRTALRNLTTLELRVRPGADRDARERVLNRWYRERVRELVPPLLAKWEGLLGVKASSWGIKRMKTRWGSCNAEARRIWLSLELAKKPVQCLEYVMVHELMHLLERSHNGQFVSLMDRHLPLWRHHRQLLNEAPLGHAEWRY